MRGKGNQVLSGFTILAFVLIAMAMAVPASADVANLAPATNSVINYPGYGLQGEPYITQATYLPDVVSGLGYDAVLVVLNEPYGALPDAADIVTTGFGFTTVTAFGIYGNAFTLDDVLPADFSDAIEDGVAFGVLDGVSDAVADDFPTGHLTFMPVARGPVILNVDVRNSENEDPTDDEIDVYFDHDVQFGASDNATLAFGSTPEFNGATLDVTQALGNDTFTLSQDAASTEDFNFIRPGVTKLFLSTNRVRWQDQNTETNTLLKILTNNEGPALVAAYYNISGSLADPSDDNMVIVMSKPVDLDAAATTDFVDFFDGDADAGGASITGQIESIVGGFTSIFQVTGLGAVPDGTTDAITNGAADDLVDYMGVAAGPSTVVVGRGVGMVRASYDDNQTASYSDDVLSVWFSENVADDTQIDIGDFEFFGFDATTVVYDDYQAGTPFSRIQFRGFTADNTPTPGSWLWATGVTGVTGDDSGEALVTDIPVIIQDESRPFRLVMVPDEDLSREDWDDVLGIDEIFLAWEETGADDSDQYFLFITRESVTNIDDDFMNAHLPDAIPIGNLRPTTNEELVQIGIRIDPDVDGVGPDTGVPPIEGGSPIAVGEQLNIVVASADWSGNIAHISDGDPFNEPFESTILFTNFIAGPLCAPRDYITDTSIPAEADQALWDHDVIHVVGDSSTVDAMHWVYGDPGAVGCDGDNVIVFDGPDPLTDNELGRTTLNADGSFDPILIGTGMLDWDDDGTLEGCIYLFNEQDDEFSDPTPIIFDTRFPTVDASGLTPYADFIFDPWNPYRCYNPGDYINIRLLAADPVSDDACGFGPSDVARNPLLHVYADFTAIDATPGMISGFGTPADSILFTSLGADQVDNDGDWLPFDDANNDGNWDWDFVLNVGEDIRDDKGLDGLGPLDLGYPGPDEGEGDGEPTFGEPFVDENGNGVFDPGETFLNLYDESDGSPGDLVWDPGEANLDCLDPDENGWYELRGAGSNDFTVRQGYELQNPISDAELDPFTVINITMEDNGIDGVEIGTMTNRPLPFTEVIVENKRTLHHVTRLNGSDPERRFLATLDTRPPTIGEITYLATKSSSGDHDPLFTDNLILPGSPVYHLGRYVDFNTTSLSDDDVLFARTRLARGVGGPWEDLTLDPGPWSGSANSDANGDGFPGAEGYDEDADSLAAFTNAFDEDEDGVTVMDFGEGYDFADREVHAASQSAEDDNDATFGNGLHSENDYTDNDNDAFFIYDSYNGGGLAGTGDIGKIYWYNIDEGDNNFDDDNDGVIDNEDPESDGYAAEDDDNEDGIVDGEAVEVPIGNAFSVLAIADFIPAIYGAARPDDDPTLVPAPSPPVPGPGVDNSVIRVDAAHVLGIRPAGGVDAKSSDFYYNELAYGDVVDPAYEIMTRSVRLFPTSGYDLAAGADTLSAADHMFNWYTTHGSENIDWEVLSQIYGLAADGVTEYQLRAVAYDKHGNAREDWSEPITFTLDLTAPLAAIPGCDDSGDPPVDFADVSADPGVQIYDAGKHPADYTLTADADDDAVQVTFEASSDPDFDDITFMATDITAPFTAEWPGGGMFTLDNYPAANADTIYFRALAEDAFGNVTDVEDACVLTVIVIDGTNPTIQIVEINGDDNLEDGTCVPPDSSITILADVFDNDGIDWVGGVDHASGDAGVDDDNDGFTDEDDVDGDGIYTEGVDDAGPDLIPGTDDDEWNGSATGANNFGETDDYITNDVVQVIFEYNPIGDVPDAGWLPLDTVHGDMDSGQTIDWTEPAVATWNTFNLETGDYDIRAYGCDIEGNCDSLTAFLTTVCIQAEPLRAYIQPEVCESETQFQLYAIHYIHDYEIDRVRFEYWFDENGDNCADAGDLSSSWVTIDLDDVNSGRGDAVLYMPSFERIGDADAIEDLAYVSDLSVPFDGDTYMYWDPDHDGYSHRDPVVVDGNLNGEWDGEIGPVARGGADFAVIGDGDEIPIGATLTAFEDDEYFADAEAGADGLDATDWIFRENEMTGDNNSLDLWNVAWDATGVVEGNYLVRAIAIDQTNQEDVLAYNCYDPANQNPEEIEAIPVDSEEPDTEFTLIDLPDGTEIDLTTTISPYVAGVNDFMKICASGSDDLARVLFEYSLNGGVDWVTMDVNNDDDFYANLDGVDGYQYDDMDEIFNDLNGNYVWDGPEVDFVRYAGANGVVDTPVGWPLLPLTGEDNIDGMDNDGDGVVDEDPDGDPATVPPADPGSPHDYDGEFCVYLDISSLPLWADVNVLFRATGADKLCDNYREDPDPAIASVIIGENMAPEADIIRAEDQDGVEIDVFPPVMDDNGVACITSATDSMAVFVTAEDITAINSVDLYYRLDPSCYDDLTFEDLQWTSMSAEGWTMPDSVYPYDFIVDVAAIPDGKYQFFPRAIDEGGNITAAPTNPWEFKKFAAGGEDFAFVSTPAPPPAAADTAAVGDEYDILGSLVDPSAEPIVAVQFWYAPRVLDESIDPTLVQPLAPYTSPELNEAILSEVGGCDGITLTINGLLGTCHESLAGLAAPTSLDYATDGDAIVFGARPAGTDVILISYNFGSWTMIPQGDEFAPYSVEWSQADGGVPEPADPSATDAYDLIATARFDLNGDWLFGDEECDYDEPRASEGNYLVLRDLERPLVQIWGLAYSAEPEQNQGSYPDWNYPGNPLFTCGDDLNDEQDWDHAFVLSGKETDVFVTAEDQGGGTIASVDLAITAEDPENPGTFGTMSYPMTKVSNGVETIDDVTVTFYPADYPQWDPADIENVILWVSTNGGASFPYKWEMTEGTDCYQVNPRLFVDTVHYYEFEVDLVGDTQETIVDARNNGFYDDDLLVADAGGQARGADPVSVIIVPDTPFWHVNIDSANDMYPHRVHRAVATATDDSGNTGTNLNSGTPDDPNDPQGAVIYIYDTEPPVFHEPPLSVLDEIDRPFNGDRVSPANDYRVWAHVNDDPFEDFNVLRIERVVFQYSPNQGGIWLDIDTDDFIGDGWVTEWTPESGYGDGFDNDLDGFTDEEDEKIHTVWLRAVAFDCGYNSVYSEPVAWTVDASEPTTCPTLPADGAVYAYDDEITIEGVPTGDSVPGSGSDDIAEVRFQVRFSNLYFVDNTFNGVGHAGDYDNGIDEIWQDSNTNGIFDGADFAVFPGQDGIFTTPNNSGTNRWFTIDPTPSDNSDDPWLESPNNGDAYTVTWIPAASQFTLALGENPIDEYVRVRMVAKDTAGNEDTADDDLPPCEKLIIINDNADNNPQAYLYEVNGDWVDPVEVYCISGAEDVEIVGTVFQYDSVSRVNVYREDSTGDVQLIGVSELADRGFGPGGYPFFVLWNADEEAEGTYELWATVVDLDNNESSSEDAVRIHVKIDRAGPSVDYTDWTSTVEYTDDGIVDHNSFAIHPDMDTWDVFFTVNSGDADVEDITLQWRFADDPVGLWRPLNTLLSPLPNGDSFDYEPNLNFDQGGETRYVWRFHVEDFPDALLEFGRMHFRALATDQAGNTNALQPLVNAQELTADGNGPVIHDWNDDSVTNQVEVGSTTNFQITVKDDYTDVTQAQLWYRNLTDSGSWRLYEGNTNPTPVPGTIDTDLGLWNFDFAWVAPSWVVHDTDYEFKLVMWDSAWNSNEEQPPHGLTITVEDNAAPDRTKLVDIFAEVQYSSDDENGVDPSDEHLEHDVWVDYNNNGQYDSGTDFLVSEGTNPGVDDPDGEDDDIIPVGDECNTFPRWVGESFLNDPNDRNVVKIANDVTLVGRTWADDDGIDSGVAEVSFWAIPTTADGTATGDMMLIGKDEVAPFFPLYYWHLTWNTLEEDVNGDRIWPDGYYRIAVSAMDQEGNAEDLTSLDITAAVILVDNEAPEATMDADPATAAFETGPITVERNGWFTLYSRVLEPGTSNEITTEDNTITWYYKRSRDLNMTDSWNPVPSSAGLTPEDGNPDETRPYSFDVQVGLLTDGTDPINDPPLAVGENYDFVMSVADEVCNTFSHMALYADSTTIGNRYLKVHVVDTIAPHLEITEAQRALPTRDGVTYGDNDVIYNPTQVHAQAFNYIQARLLTGHRDVEYAEFVYRKMVTSGDPEPWNLIDADLSIEEGEDETIWTLGNWDLRALEHGAWYEVGIVGVDDVGNVDQNPDIMKVYVDYEAPQFTLISPAPTTSHWCDFELTSSTDRIMDLVAQVDRGSEGVHDDVYDVIWDVKLSRADSTYYGEYGVASSDELYDDTLNYYSNTINLYNLEDSDLYDMRVTLVDESGNTRSYWVYKNTVDLDDPDYVQISNISWEGDDTTQDPTDQGQYTDVTAGTMVEIFGTASDDEPNLPNLRDPQTNAFYETGIAIMQFQVAYDAFQDGEADTDEEWRDLGTYIFDPDDLGDISAQTGSVLWNTTGLFEGQYLVRVGVRDECQNPTTDFAWSVPVNVRVVDNTPPVARIACWDADLQPHGLDAPSRVVVYALAESDPDIVDVQFQYNIVEDGETSPTGPWVNFGVPSDVTDDEFTTEMIWWSMIDPGQFDSSVNQLWLRALVKDSSGLRTEDVVPTMMVNIVEEFDGTINFEPVPSADLTGGTEMVENVTVQFESPENAIVTVDMATADQTPRVVVLWEDLNADEYPSWDNPTNYSPGVANVGFVRSLNDPTVWRGEIDINHHDCQHYRICVTGVDTNAPANLWVDLDDLYIREYEVTNALGTNGTVMVPAYDDLGIWVDVPSGGWPYFGPACLMVSPTLPPFLDHDQAMYLNPVANTAYYARMDTDESSTDFTPGFYPLVTIEYSDEFAALALEGTTATEEDLTVRWFFPYTPVDANLAGGSFGQWTGAGISHIQVDTEANQVSFRISGLGEIFDYDPNETARGGYSLGGAIFQVFAPESGAPVLFSGIWPESPYVNDWWTDADPSITVYLQDPGGQEIDPEEVELWIDGEPWATWLDGAGSAEFVRGNGRGDLTQVNAEGTIYELVYYHSTFPRDWLEDGEHTLTVRYQASYGTDDWMEGNQTFFVDRQSPYIEFDGGAIGNPALININGYMNPANDSLMVKLYDAGTGILFKHNRHWYLPDADCDGYVDGDDIYFDPRPEPIPSDYDEDEYGDFCWNEVDWGVKYDIWLVDLEDDQADIDEIEERILLHQGTADELVPWMTPSLDEYSPAEDTLRVPVPIVGGGMIQHKDVIEITWYSEKFIEANSDGPGLGCSIDTLTVDGSSYLIYGMDCTYDTYSQEMHYYNQGIIDWARNTGSRYVEQRFIVDMKGPNCVISSPAATVAPDGDLQIMATLYDDGAGIDDDAVTVVVVDPEGNTVEFTEGPNVEDGVVTGTIEGPLVRGEYTVTIRGADKLGNRCSVTKTVKAQSELLGVTQAYTFPNPFDPASSNANIRFTLSKPADVTIKVYDFAGDFVTTLANNYRADGGDVNIEWGGEAADGTDLANGTYICRVEATDGNRTEEVNLKVVIWRE